MSRGGSRRARWLKQLHRWHWISAALGLTGTLLFALTGWTLNHAADIEAAPRVRSQQVQLPPEVRARLDGLAHGPLPPPVRARLAQDLNLDLDARDAEWSPEEVYLALPQPGGDAWLRIDRRSGATEYEHTSRGWIAYLNDLHKGRHTGPVWSVFIDAMALACVVFAVTGLVLLKLHDGPRPWTWPLVGLGLAVPVLLALLFIH